MYKNRKQLKGQINFMKYQRHLFKNVKNEQLLIVINFNFNNINQIIDDHFRKHQETTKIHTIETI